MEENSRPTSPGFSDVDSDFSRYDRDFSNLNFTSDRGLTQFGGGRGSYQLQGTLIQSDDARIKQDIIRMIIQYLQSEGYTASMMTIQDEANVKLGEHFARRAHMKKLKKAILEGDWAEVEKLCTKSTFKNYKSFLYAVYKQQYLEAIESGEYQKAFTFLTKRLKPLESVQSYPTEFRDLCYLLTCRSIQEVPAFRNWDGASGSSREKLVEQFQTMLDFENDDLEFSGTAQVPPNRLLQLMNQAVAYQLTQIRHRPKAAPKITSLLSDYASWVIPNSIHMTWPGARANVKCVGFLGEQGSLLVAGASDNMLRVYELEGESEEPMCLLGGHRSRVWELSTMRSGEKLASASADGTVKIWSVNQKEVERTRCVATLTGHEGDVYTVKVHPGQNHVASGGYDKTVRLYDARTGALVKSFAGHTASVSSVVFNPHGNLIVSGSKDCTIKFWDIVSGLCIKTLTHLGEVTAVDLNVSGSLLLSSSKDNSNRLWDLRTSKAVRRLKGHQNTYKNFVRSIFGGVNSKLVFGGSEDGFVHVWDTESGELLQKLAGHQGPVFDVAWNNKQSLLASCSDDCTVKTWWYDETLPGTGEPAEA